MALLLIKLSQFATNSCCQEGGEPKYVYLIMLPLDNYIRNILIPSSRHGSDAKLNTVARSG